MDYKKLWNDLKDSLFYNKDFEILVYMNSLERKQLVYYAEGQEREQKLIQENKKEPTQVD